MVYEQHEIEESLRKWDAAKVNTMINHGVSFEQLYIPNKTDVLLETIVRKNIILFKKVLKKGFPILEREFLYLHHAIKTNDIMYVELLLSYAENKKLLGKTDPYSKNNCLHIACNNSISQEIILLLSKNGANWNAQNIYGQTSFHALLRYYPVLNPELLENIMQQNIKFNLKDNLGISCKDIIKSLSLDEDWITEENNQYLLSKING
jgi:ankyrin repeat protein